MKIGCCVRSLGCLVFSSFFFLSLSANFRLKRGRYNTALYANALLIGKLNGLDDICAFMLFRENSLLRSFAKLSWFFFNFISSISVNFRLKRGSHYTTLLSPCLPLFCDVLALCFCIALLSLAVLVHVLGFNSPRMHMDPKC